MRMVGDQHTEASSMRLGASVDQDDKSVSSLNAETPKQQVLARIGGRKGCMDSDFLLRKREITREDPARRRWNPRPGMH